MNPTGPNPALLQGNELQASSVPLFLIHDGGGTINGYSRLGPLGRDVYGIFNPRLQRSDPDTGGRQVQIPEMAGDYCMMIRETRSEGDILLGGWSLGGFVALEMARIFAEDPAINVVGLVMMECIYPRAISEDIARVDVRDISLGGITPDLQKKITAGIMEATEMVRAWELPEWTDFEVPAAALLRAQHPVPSRQGVEIPPMLGWDQYAYPLVRSVYEVSGHHFSIFDPANIGGLSSALNEACVLLELGM